MNCYDFELKISAYIEGELKQVVRDDFNQHKDACNNCIEKLVDISKLMKYLPDLEQVTTSSQFDKNLQGKIRGVDNRGPSILKRLLEMKPLGFEPVPAMGFAFAMAMIIGASFLILNQDNLPDLDFEKLSTKSQQKIPPEFTPSVISPKKNLPSMADSDTSGKSNSKKLENRIKLVGGK